MSCDSFSCKVLPGTVQRTEKRAVSLGLGLWTSEGSQCPPQEYKETSHVLLPQHGHQSPAFYSLFSRKQTLGGRSQLWLVAMSPVPRAGPAWYLNRINKAGGGGPRDRKQRRPSAASFLCLPPTCLYPLRRGQESPPGHPQAQALAVRNSDGGLATRSMPTWLPFQLSTSARLKI